MKFQPDANPGVNLISRHEPGCVWVGATAFRHSLLLPATGLAQPWPPTLHEELSASHFDQVAAMQPEVVIFGSGERLRFVKPALLRALIERGIGVETMDTAAACRTYNVLAAEGRTVLAALLVPTGPSAPRHL